MLRKPARLGKVQLRRLGVFAATLVCTAALTLEVSAYLSRQELSRFTLARTTGWSIAPVRAVPTGPLSRWELSSLPSLSAADQQFIRECEEYRSSDAGASFTGPGPFKRLLARHPRAFLAEYQLALWHLSSHDLAGYHQWFALSLRDAPAVLAGRVQSEDGSPVAGHQLLLCLGYDGPGHLNRGSEIFYPVVTDASGCYYLPVYRAVCSSDGRSAYASIGTAGEPSPDCALVENKLPPNRFVLTSRIGVLPPLTARPFVQMKVPAAWLRSSMEKPVILRGSTLSLAWAPYPGAIRYHVAIEGTSLRSIPHVDTVVSSTGHEDLPHTPIFNEGSPHLELQLPLNSTDPVLNHNNTYCLTVAAMNGGKEISESRVLCFRPLEGLAPPPPTPGALTRALGPQFKVVSVTRIGQEMTVTVDCKQGADPVRGRLGELLGAYWNVKDAEDPKIDPANPTVVRFVCHLDMPERPYDELQNGEPYITAESSR